VVSSKALMIGDSIAERVDLSLGPHNYPLILGYDILHNILASGIMPTSSRFFIVTDNMVAKMYGRALTIALERAAPTTLIVHPKGEHAKSLLTVHRMLRMMLSDGADRSSTIVAVGGGVTGNLAGLAAGLLFRGIHLVHVPTTLLAMMDSIISIKQGANCHRTKNGVGIYHAPVAAIIDVAVLRTLPMRHLRSGLCEAVKNCLVLGSDLQSTLPNATTGAWHRRQDPQEWASLIAAHIRRKAALLSDDANESQAGLIFEYGHTVGHALETLSGGRLLHGEAVGYGLLAAARVARSLGLLGTDDVLKHFELLRLVGHGLRSAPELDPSIVVRQAFRDNKRGLLAITKSEEIPMVLLEAVGRPIWSGQLPLVPVPSEVLYESIAGMQQ
jgi:3-dehydroquinate synthetase